MKEKSSKQIVMEAIEDLYWQEQVVTREALVEHTGLKRSVIDDKVKALRAEDMVISRERGIYEPAKRHPPARHCSVSFLPDGMTILELGDDMLKATPREARNLGLALHGWGTQAIELERSRQNERHNAELLSRVRDLERIVRTLVTALQPSP